MQPVDLPFDMPADIDDNVGIMQFVTGEADGRAFWAYLVMRPSRYLEYLQKVDAREEINLMQYGEVIEKGWGTEAPEAVKQRMSSQYGASDSFQQELEEFVREELAKEEKTEKRTEH
jgi:hypothetical protein